MLRTPVHHVTAHQQREGGGFLVRRPFPTQGLDFVDPLLMLDEMGPVTYGPGEAVGAPDHPHRGFETVTYILEGEGAHADSAGNSGVIGPGDVQWMTAGDGVVHREMPSRQLQEHGGTMHGFQLWVNLPRTHKRMAPRYQDLRAADIPEATSPDGRVRLRVIAGEALGVSAPTRTVTPVTYLHARLDAGAALDLPVSSDHNLAVYVFEGSVEVGGTGVGRGQLVVLGPGDTLRLTTDAPAQALVLGGQPLNEPVAWGGPFVMNTRGEVRQAYRDFQDGHMGSIPPEIVKA
jgi:quercetin 2,3-dioxygenase